jgi:hypothetical protein
MDGEELFGGLTVDSLAYAHERLGSEPARLQRYKAPCAGCLHRQRCAAQLLACRVFRTFVYLPSKTDYGTERMPTRAVYEAVFGTNDGEGADG